MVHRRWNRCVGNILGDYSGSNNASNSGDWLNTANNIASGVGLAGTGLGMVDGTFRMMKSGQISPGYYASGWSTGNQYVKATYSVSKFGTGISAGANAFTTYIAYDKIFNGTQEPITYADAGVGTMGIIASSASYLYGVQIPIVGEFVGIYGVVRVTWDVFFNLGVNYGPRNW